MVASGNVVHKSVVVMVAAISSTLFGVEKKDDTISSEQMKSLEQPDETSSWVCQEIPPDGGDGDTKSLSMDIKPASA